MRLEEAPHALCELRSAQHERRVVIAKNLKKLRGPARASTKLLAMQERYHLVVATVDHECRYVHTRHVRRGWILKAHQQAHGQIPVKGTGEIRHRRKRRDENQRRRSHVLREVCRNRTSKRFTNDHDASGRKPLLVRQVVPCGLSIEVGALLSRRTTASSKAAIVEQEHCESHAAEDLEPIQAVPYIAGIAVTEEYGRGARWPRHVPAVQADAVGRRQLDLFKP